MAGIYVHIPFCAKKCAYCDFYSIGTTAEKDALLSAVEKDLALRRDIVKEQPIETLYIGGGTPSLYHPDKIGELISHIDSLFDTSALKEATIEVNPEDITESFVAALRKTRINRVSVGIQSFDEQTLQWMRRRHTAQKGIEAIKLLQGAGFDNLSIDLIYGIPGMTDIQWRNNLETALSLNVQHLSAYHLTIEKGTYFGRLSASGKLRPVEDAVSTAHYEILLEQAAQYGFSQYEISNYARHPRYRSLHNSNYWNGTPYLGVGPSAHSFDGENCREWVVCSVKEYIEKINSGQPYTENETLSRKDKVIEHILLSLRTGEGINLTETKERFPEYTEGILRAARPFIATGQMTFEAAALRINQKDLLISDYIISHLLP